MDPLSHWKVPLISTVKFRLVVAAVWVFAVQLLTVVIVHWKVRINP